MESDSYAMDSGEYRRPGRVRIPACRPANTRYNGSPGCLMPCPTPLRRVSNLAGFSGEFRTGAADALAQEVQRIVGLRAPEVWLRTLADRGAEGSRCSLSLVDVTTAALERPLRCSTWSTCAFGSEQRRDRGLQRRSRDDGEPGSPSCRRDHPASLTPVRGFRPSVRPRDCLAVTA